jgi:hypothetical protein
MANFMDELAPGSRLDNPEMTKLLWPSYIGTNIYMRMYTYTIYNRIYLRIYNNIYIISLYVYTYIHIYIHVHVILPIMHMTYNAYLQFWNTVLDPGPEPRDQMPRPNLAGFVRQGEASGRNWCFAHRDMEDCWSAWRVHCFSISMP